MGLEYYYLSLCLCDPDIIENYDLVCLPLAHLQQRHPYKEMLRTLLYSFKYK